ncbi:MAG: MFS transporter [Betaproteobacteria bacterium]|nr:MFS transporter [Betaproteobacteria bacterium]
MSDPFAWRNTLAYGLLGLPLAFAALPLYVILPNHYAKAYGVPLAALGLVLLGARLFDAVLDPWLGRLSDRWLARSSRAVLGAGAASAVMLAVGLLLLFSPDYVLNEPAPSDLLVWAAATLILTYLGYSFLSIAHQSWGALLGGNEWQRSRLTSTREWLALMGVLLASVLPGLVGLPLALLVFVALLALAWWAWSRSEPPPRGTQAAAGSLWLPWQDGRFRRLLAVFVLNGIASAVPATLVLFFVQDRLQAPTQWEPAFLGTYFLSAAASMPAWIVLVRRIGLARSWLLGMLLAVAVFIWAAGLGTGDALLFLAVCVLSGFALGADLALPSAMLAGLLQRPDGVGPTLAGTSFGWWNFAAKLNLALAAGLALPLLELLGYVPGAREAQALQALTLAYCVLPCVLKLLAAWALYVWIIRAERPPKEEWAT